MAPKPNPPASGPAAATRGSTKKTEPVETADVPPASGDASQSDLGESTPPPSLESISAQLSLLIAGSAKTQRQLDGLVTRVDVLESGGVPSVDPAASSTTPVAPSTTPVASLTTTNPPPSTGLTARDEPKATSDSSSSAPAITAPTASSAPHASLWNHLSAADRNNLACMLGGYGHALTQLFGPAAAAHLSTPDGVQALASAVEPVPYGTRILECKLERLGTFTGDPKKLEKFFSDVADIARSNTHPMWDSAVVVAIPQALTGDARTWHAEQRQLARDRRWQPLVESAMTYFFDKVQLWRHALAERDNESILAQEIVDGLEATMRAYIRMPSEKPTLELLQSALAEWEPTWREVYHIPLHKSSSSAPTSTAYSATVATVASQPPARPARSELRNSPANSAPSPSRAPAPVRRDKKLSEDFDPARLGRGLRPGTSKENVPFLCGTQVSEYLPVARY
ncbi:hypothetical protein CF319_g9397 [Tilletia indica]|uniref:Uncharacterized protein n=1 Tax=Tilletia indica TaxID=43049 RepID=A0A8T8SKP0_9BASI|nr:hypothetical protein CF319_g9397 [Tilletia indica]KAE8242512.1 hypothetical protein A4X13_0g7128 [Tilletia indica]